MIILRAERYVRQAHNLKVVGSNPAPTTNLKMLEKIEILIVIFILLLSFYIVISFGAGKKKDIEKNVKIKNYLFGVRVLITIIAIISLILWFFF